MLLSKTSSIRYALECIFERHAEDEGMQGRRLKVEEGEFNEREGMIVADGCFQEDEMDQGKANRPGEVGAHYEADEQASRRVSGKPCWRPSCSTIARR